MLSRSVCQILALAVMAAAVHAADVYVDGFSSSVGAGSDGTGSPVGNPNTNGLSISLGNNGSVTVTFSDNAIFDRLGNDFTVIDENTQIQESYKVEASSVGSGGPWTFIGNGVSTTPFDLNGSINRVVALKITDLNSTDPEPDRGLDLDAVRVVQASAWDLKISKVSSSFIPTNSNTAAVTATIDPSVAGKIKFQLFAVSTEPGHAMNYGDESPSTRDLLFEAQAGFTVTSLTANTTSEATSATVNVSSKDYGAYGKIEAFITQITGTTISPQIKGHVDGDTTEYITVPLDDNSNFIADGDARNNGSTGGSDSATADDEIDPFGNGVDGDSLSLYQEYRGFIINGSHVRTDQNKKDVFVWNSDGLPADWLNTLPALIRYVSTSEIGSETRTSVYYRQINRKSETADLGKQTAIRVERDTGYHPTFFLVLGEIFTTSDDPDVPNNFIKGYVYEGNIIEHGADLRGAITAESTEIKTYSQQLIYRNSGKIKIENEIISYNGVTLDQNQNPPLYTFVGCVRGIDGTTAVSHIDDVDIAGYINTDDVKKMVYAHETAHSVRGSHHDVDESPGNQNIMFGDIKRGSYLGGTGFGMGTGVYSDYGGSLDSVFSVKQ